MNWKKKKKTDARLVNWKKNKVQVAVVNFRNQATATQTAENRRPSCELQEPVDRLLNCRKQRTVSWSARTSRPPPELQKTDDRLLNCKNQLTASWTPGSRRPPPLKLSSRQCSSLSHTFQTGVLNDLLKTCRDKPPSYIRFSVMEYGLPLTD